MEGLRQYILSVTIAAILCGILTSFFEKKGTMSSILRLMAGLFLTAAVIGPVARLQISDLSGYLDGLSLDASAAAEAGTNAAREALSAGIKSRTEAYILDKAESWGAELTVEVSVSDSDPPVPRSVRLSGRVSPYVKTRISQMLETELGIAKEDQIWTG